MAAQAYAHPAIAAGLAGGIGLMAPAAAYAATMSLEGAHEVIEAGGVPFALGAVAGAGMCAIACALLNRHVALSAFRAEDAFEARAAQAADGAARAVEEDDASRFFAGRHAPKGVPVISRAQDALSEAEAWAEIDALLSEDSPISCDPERSKDVYQIALEELQRASQPAARAGHAAAAAPTPVYPVRVAADTTATFMAAASAAAQVTATLGGEAARLSDTDAARQAALSSLDALSDSFDLDEPFAPAAAAAAVVDVSAAVADEPAAAAVVSPASAQVTAVAEAPAQASAEEVPMADYSGHEEMWAAALAILAEEPASALPVEAEETASAAPIASAPRIRHEAAAPESERAQALAEGERETEMHGRVNEILGEELARVPSKSVRHTSREFLRVIQGGTMSMPRLQAEA